MAVEIIKLQNGSDYESSMDLADMVKSKSISHGICIYRNADSGDLCYRILGSKNGLTFLLGMIEAVKLGLYKDATS